MSVLVDGIEIDYSGLPETHRETVRLYIEHGIHPGSGWQLILSRDLWAILAVDEWTAKSLPQVVRWLHNHAPSECHGSSERFNSWMKQRRAA